MACISGAQDLPSQFLFVAKRREHGGVIFVREALINGIVRSTARSFVWIWK